MAAKVKQDPEKPLDTEVLADAIVKVAEAAQQLLNGPLARRAIVVLISDYLGASVPKKNILAVLDAAAELKRTYVK